MAGGRSRPHLSHLRELGLASDKTGRDHWGVEQRRWRQRRPWCDVFRAHIRGQRHGGDEPVAAPIQRLDEPGTLRVILKRATQLFDARGQRRVADGHVLPDRTNQIVFRDNLSRMAGEEGENRE